MSDISYQQLPLAYRLSQWSMGGVLLIIVVVRRLAMPQWPMVAKWSVLSVTGCIFVFALGAASYVVIRYPYLSLIQLRDEDKHSAFFSSPTIARLICWLGLLTLFLFTGMAVGIAAREGGENPILIIAAIYAVVLFLFVLFLCVRYDPVRHPTIATFIRSTLGVGVLVVPLFIPILIIATLRCRRLLADTPTFCPPPNDYSN
jgi:hypothetical protein